jgi:hypothetical protein
LIDEAVKRQEPDNITILLWTTVGMVACRATASLSDYAGRRSDLGDPGFPGFSFTSNSQPVATPLQCRRGRRYGLHRNRTIQQRRQGHAGQLYTDSCTLPIGAQQKRRQKRHHSAFYRRTGRQDDGVSLYCK